MSSPTAMKPDMEEDGLVAPIESQVDAPLLLLPWELLVRICHGVYAWDLFHLGQTCRRLRQVTRHCDAWKFITYPDYLDTTMSMPVYHPLDSRELWALLHRDDTMPLLRVAPALDTLRLRFRWPPVDFLQYTKQVRVFEVVWPSPRFEEPPEPWRLARTLQHYKGHLQEVRLDRMLYGCLLKDIDALGIKELYIADNLCRVYPGSTKTITQLKFDGDQIDGDALAEVLLGCRETLMSFRMYAAFVHKNPWAHVEDESGVKVCQALKQCTNLEVAKITTWGDVTMLGSFPKLRKLTLCDFGCDAPALNFFRSSPVMGGLESLSLRLGFYAHRGVLRAVAEGCRNLRLLRLIPDQAVESRGLMASVDLPSDLHLILGRLVDLDTLAIYEARLRSTVLDGLAGGALPLLRKLLLHGCGLTPKARSALDSLRARRPDLAVVEKHPQVAVREKDNHWLAFSERCYADACDVDSNSENSDSASDSDDSESEDEDPIPGDHDYDTELDTVDPHADVERLSSFLDPSDTECDGNDCGSSSSSD
ncbi:uncharacterized protein LOC117640176 isoform X2 [Thrips palmi]|uniref:Uncharacterized protein LOC117640176 isoform X2 n=1 Tax=Thrips palmi TaxID=161013 RepID=A0A6P8Y6Z8_THRPL|nr:uncharacterized protein LOC117640176 isoform X2 [Thrips palmi]